MMFYINLLAWALMGTQYLLTSINPDIVLEDYIYVQMHSLTFGLIVCQMIQMVLSRDDKAVCASAVVFVIGSLTLRKYSSVETGLSLYPALVYKALKSEEHGTKGTLMFLLCTFSAPLLQLLIMYKFLNEKFALWTFALFILMFVLIMLAVRKETSKTQKLFGVCVVVVLSLLFIILTIRYEPDFVALKEDHERIGSAFMQLFNDPSVSMLVDETGCIYYRDYDRICGGDLFTLLGASKLSFFVYVVELILFVSLLFIKAKHPVLRVMVIIDGICFISCLLRCLGLVVPYGCLPFEGFTSISTFTILLYMNGEEYNDEAYKTV